MQNTNKIKGKYFNDTHIIDNKLEINHLKMLVFRKTSDQAGQRQSNGWTHQG